MARKAESDAARREKAGLPPHTPSVPSLRLAEPTAQLTGTDDDQPVAAETLQSDWETTDFEIDLRFLPNQIVRMSLGGAAEVEGTWEVITRSLDRVTVEIRTESSPRAGTTIQPESGDDPAPEEVRRFVIRFEGEAKDRFTLQEEGADPDVGSLLFHKVEE